MDASDNIIESIYAQWARSDNRYHEDEPADRGEDLGHLLKVVLSKPFKKHVHNIHRQ